MDWKQQWPTVAQVKAANPEAFAAALAWVVPEHEFVPPFMLAIVAFIAGYEAREKRSDDDD